MRRLAPLALGTLGGGMVLVVAGVVVPGLFMPGVYLIAAGFLALAIAGVVQVVHPGERSDDA